jgi:hypothetical protein
MFVGPFENSIPEQTRFKQAAYRHPATRARRSAASNRG